jgi:DNA-binding NtrC family response regulator
LDKKIRILVAEEGPSFLRVIEDSLLASGGLYHTDIASSGEQCFKMLKKEKFDILLLNRSLPDGEGLNWLRRFNELGIGIPTIFVTAKGDPRLAIEAIKKGVFDYINRPAECARAFPFVSIVP